MKGVVLAGGTGSRLFPLTRVTNKHLLPVGRYPMIYHPLLRLRRAGVTDIVLVTSPEHMGDVVNLLGSGSRLGIDLTYRVQDEPGGIAQALGLCETFVGNDPFVVVLGDNILGEDLTAHVAAFEAQTAAGGGARVLLKEVHDPERYGVPEFQGDRIVRVIEKPSVPPSSYSVVGIYFYEPGVFDFIRTLSPSQRGELEISDVSNRYAQAGTLTHGVLQSWWGDAGTFEGLEEANRLARDLVYEEHPGVADA
ncbi:MAG: sugar phosphate nucleotidyltransferase [Bacteroidetes bacterium]|nr:sugar phosphate nucleotidyltransferase [Bacteroidota bacterium]